MSQPLRERTHPLDEPVEEGRRFDVDTDVCAVRLGGSATPAPK